MIHFYYQKIIKYAKKQRKCLNEFFIAINYQVGDLGSTEQEKT